MDVSFKPVFFRDFTALPSDVKIEVKYLCETIFPGLKSLRELTNYPTKPIAGFKHYYRIKVGDYRVGFKFTGSVVEFMRVKHRKDIYRHFP